MHLAERADRRREARLNLNLPVHIKGYESDGSAWEFDSTTLDASTSGVCFSIPRPVVRGQCLWLALPLPNDLRRYDIQGPTYPVFSLVRSVESSGASWRVGTLFFGTQPPPGFDKNPGARYLFRSDLADEPAPAAEPAPVAPHPKHAPDPEPLAPPDPQGRRQHERFELFVNFALQQADEWGAVLGEELTVAENISRGGVRLKTTVRLGKGDVVFIREMGGPFEARAEVRNSYVAADRVRRLNLAFLDGRVPEHLVRKR